MFQSRRSGGPDAVAVAVAIVDGRGVVEVWVWVGAMGVVVVVVVWEGVGESCEARRVRVAGECDGEDGWLRGRFCTSGSLDEGVFE